MSLRTFGIIDSGADECAIPPLIEASINGLHGPGSLIILKKTM